jgi:hypothetical protein
MHYKGARDFFPTEHIYAVGQKKGINSPGALVGYKGVRAIGVHSGVPRDEGHSAGNKSLAPLCTTSTPIALSHL